MKKYWAQETVKWVSKALDFHAANPGLNSGTIWYVVSWASLGMIPELRDSCKLWSQLDVAPNQKTKQSETKNKQQINNKQNPKGN